MRRLGALFALAFFVTVPILQWRCVVACAEESGPERAACPHASAAIATPTLQDDHDCEHPASPAMLASMVTPNLILHAIPAARIAAVGPTSVEGAKYSMLGTAPPGGPPVRVAVPLRI